MIKKILINIIIAILLISITSIFWNIPKIKYDVNNDFKVDSKDILELRRYLLGE